jgi:hypothetical protein
MGIVLRSRIEPHKLATKVAGKSLRTSTTWSWRLETGGRCSRPQGQGCEVSTHTAGGSNPVPYLRCSRCPSLRNGWAYSWSAIWSGCYERIVVRQALVTSHCAQSCEICRSILQAQTAAPASETTCLSPRRCCTCKSCTCPDCHGTNGCGGRQTARECRR